MVRMERGSSARGVLLHRINTIGIWNNQTLEIRYLTNQHLLQEYPYLEEL